MNILTNVVHQGTVVSCAFLHSVDESNFFASHIQSIGEIKLVILLTLYLNRKCEHGSHLGLLSLMQLPRCINKYACMAIMYPTFLVCKLDHRFETGNYNLTRLRGKSVMYVVSKIYGYYSVMLSIK